MANQFVLCLKGSAACWALVACWNRRQGVGSELAQLMFSFCSYGFALFIEGNLPVRSATSGRAVLCLHFPGVGVDLKALQWSLECILKIRFLSFLCVLVFFKFTVKCSFRESCIRHLNKVACIRMRWSASSTVCVCLSDQLKNEPLCLGPYLTWCDFQQISHTYTNIHTSVYQNKLGI